MTAAPRQQHNPARSKAKSLAAKSAVQNALKHILSPRRGLGSSSQNQEINDQALRERLSHICPDLPLDHIHFKGSARSKRLTLRVDQKNNGIHCIIPKYAGLEDICRFIERQEAWIMARLLDLPAPIPFAHGHIIPIFGLDKRIEVIPAQGRVTKITEEDERLLVQTSRDNPSSNIKKWLIEKARDDLTQRSHDKAAQIGKTIKDITLRDTGSRWGSCTSERRISYSWRMVFTPEFVRDYICAHEVSHLQHMDHSAAFWDLCDDLSENMPRGREWLKIYGRELMRYGQ